MTKSETVKYKKEHIQRCDKEWNTKRNIKQQDKECNTKGPFNDDNDTTTKSETWWQNDYKVWKPEYQFNDDET